MEYLLEIVEQASEQGGTFFLKWLSKQNGLSKQGRVEETFRIVEQAACLVDDIV